MLYLLVYIVYYYSINITTHNKNMSRACYKNYKNK